MKLTLNTKALKGIHYGKTLRPSRDWLVLITVVFVLLLVSVGWNLWAFRKVTEGDSIGIEAPVEDSGSPAVDAAHKLFEDRALEEGRYKSEYRFVDPSR